LEQKYKNAFYRDIFTIIILPKEKLLKRNKNSENTDL